MRIILKRPLNDIYLDLEAPAQSITVTRALNAPGSIDIQLPLDYLRKKGEDGKPILQEFGTLVIVEDDNRIIQVGLVDQIEMTASAISVSAGGLTMLATGTPYLGTDKSYVSTDPLKIFKDIWSHIQSYKNADLGIKITGSTKSTGTLGTQASGTYTARKNALDAAVARHKVPANKLAMINKDKQDTFKKIFNAAGMNFIGKISRSNNAPSKDQSKVLWFKASEGGIQAWNAKSKTWQFKHTANEHYKDYLALVSIESKTKQDVKLAQQVVNSAKDSFEKVKDQASQPYLVNWYSTQDLAQTITELREAGPFDYRETASWNGDDLALGLLIGAPQIGSRKEDLRFELGVNVIDQPATALQDPYTHVLQLGAGEGSKQHRVSKTWAADGRVRRVLVSTDKDAKTLQSTQHKATQALSQIQRKTGFGIEALTVLDHPWARRTEFEPGDSIRVTGPLSDGSDLDIWVRVLELTMTDTESVLNLKVETL